jgi:hypothetical protein
LQKVIFAPESSYFLAQKCVFKEKRAPRGSMELIRQTQKGPPGEPVGPVNNWVTSAISPDFSPNYGKKPLFMG